MTIVSRNVEIPADDDGYIDRKCPASQCGHVFKVGADNLGTTDSVTMFCPFCRHEDEPDQFTTDEQQEYLQREAERFAQELLNEMLGGFVRKQSARPLRRPFSITWKTELASIPASVPATVLDEMALRITCDNCACSYAVIGAGYFCPLCGANSIRHTFQQAVNKARTTVRLVRELEGVPVDRDTVAVGVSVLLESQIENLATAFQSLATNLYIDLPGNPSAPKNRNLFQNLDDGSKEWNKAKGRSFDQILSVSEYRSLGVYFQKRHKLSHTGGIVDDLYLERSGDTTYKLGQRITISETHVLEMADLVEKLGLGLMADAPSTASTSPQLATTPTRHIPRKIPQLSDKDWSVYLALCEAVIASESDTLSGDALWEILDGEEMTEEDFGDSVEMLESRSLALATRFVEDRNVPAAITLLQRGLAHYYSETMTNYNEKMKSVAVAIVGDSSSSNQISDLTGLSLLFVHQALRNFESRGWIGEVFWNSGIGIVPFHNVQLKRFAKDEPC